MRTNKENKKWRVVLITATLTLILILIIIACIRWKTKDTKEIQIREEPIIKEEIKQTEEVVQLKEGQFNTTQESSEMFIEGSLKAITTLIPMAIALSMISAVIGIIMRD